MGISVFILSKVRPYYTLMCHLKGGELGIVDRAKKKEEKKEGKKEKRDIHQRKYYSSSFDEHVCYSIIRGVTPPSCNAWATKISKLYKLLAWSLKKKGHIWCNKRQNGVKISQITEHSFKLEAKNTLQPLHFLPNLSFLFKLVMEERC